MDDLYKRVFKEMRKSHDQSEDHEWFWKNKELISKQSNWLIGGDGWA